MRTYPLTIIVFSPKLPCMACDTLTGVAVLNPVWGNSFNPTCALHGFLNYDGTHLDEPTPAHLEQQRFLIGRFVLSYHANAGRVVLISKVAPDTIPGYEPTRPEDLDLTQEQFDRRHIDDMAWYARYVAPGGERLDCHVVWSWDYLQFFAYQDGQQITE